ncbi:hypothetical protein SYK_13080 [Pseudodesulfovibrio nedwellii]|uniref:Uncharacterized protein n=1 Tax=Pseudodesulfovibrio nedwellii TaxID=2973072 RepID=A0ABN6S4Q4_9BACT|nr:hypothetical protein [Pseudodesulfovibrio nedwellii]BDQ36948.1 hypothetical protein SYK_13080 [Pseudodesulfovibrio nedwellii]
MFKQKIWPFIGASGTEYPFTILPKSEKLPQSAGVFILAYTHPRGHMAGWKTTPILINHADNIALTLDTETQLNHNQTALWNSNFVLLEPSQSAREKCVHDLKILESKDA